MSDILKRCKKISTFLEKKDNQELEIEVKIRDVRNEEFYLFFDYLRQKHRFEKEFSIDYYIGDKRISEINNEYYDTSKTFMMEPFFLETAYKTLKFTVAREENKPVKPDSIKNHDKYRKKNRFRFSVNNFYIDLTEVYTSDTFSYSYEIEIEVKDSSKYTALSFSKIIEENIKILTLDYSHFISFCNTCISNGKTSNNDKIDRNYISRPRDLLKQDVTHKNSILRGFTVSVKADGVPYFLVFFNMKIYLVSDKSEIIFIGFNKSEKLNNSLFSGELISREKLKDPTFTDFMNVYLPFDTIYFNSKDTTQKNYLERFDYIKNIKDLEIVHESTKKIKIIEKKIFNLGVESDLFYKEFKKCYHEKKNVFYYDDGYIFTPINSPYLTEGQIYGKKPRYLSRYLEVCKFKPLEKRSVDFLVREDGLNYWDKGKYRIFRKMKYSLDFPTDIENKIVEFFPKISEGKVVSIFPQRIRYDKSYPNSKNIVDDIVNSYEENNPITEKTLLGEDTVLMRAFKNYHIKGTLIDLIKGFVIDIGSGKGGDIGKFGNNKKINKVLSVEPNLQFSEEFMKRLSKTRFQDKFHILKGVNGEDSDRILEGMTYFPKVMSNFEMNVTFMISLSFFWKSPETLAKLGNTLKNINREYKLRGGLKPMKIIFFTIDGYKLENFFTKIGKNRVKLGNSISLIFDGINKINVNIEDSKTVFINQEEYLVKLDQLFDLIGAKIVERGDPNAGNILMSDAERTYLSLFTYGIAEMQEIEEIKPLEKIYINEDIGVEIDDLILAKGDDVLENINYLGSNFFRLGTLDIGSSLVHSVLKLTREDYRESNVYNRIRLAEDFEKQLSDKNNIREICENLNIGIKIFYGDKVIDTFSKDYENVMYLNKCLEGEFEPIVYINNKKVVYIFGKDN